MSRSEPMDDHAEIERELLRGNVPLLILATLRDGPMHGYAIAKEINRRTGNSLRFKQGSLYPVLTTLENNGHLAGDWTFTGNGRPRKEYSLTPLGRIHLAERLSIWEKFCAAVQFVIQPSH